MQRKANASFIAVLAGAILIAGAFSLGNARSVDAAPRPTMQAIVDAWNARDVAGFLNLMTDRGLRELVDFDTRAEAQEFLPFFIGDPPVRLLAVQNITGTLGASSALVDLSIGIGIERADATFVLEGGIWKLDSWAKRDAPVAAGTTVIEVRMQEYAFVYDRQAASAGNIAFAARNVGREEHELVLIRITRPEPLAQIIMLPEAEEGPPPGVEPLAFEFYEPGEARVMAFTQPLSAGRYGLVCFVPAPDGTPHAFLGMFSEFTVGVPPATPVTTIAPPATGNAGLLGDGAAGTIRLAMLATGSLVLLAGLGGLTAAAARR